MRSGRALAAQGEHALLDLERVAAGAAERAVHRREQRDGGAAVVGAQLDHRAREVEPAVELGDERARPALHVEHEAGEPFRELLAHDARRDERDGLDGPGDVAQRVHLAVGRGDLRGLADERAAEALELARGGGEREVGAEARDALELVERAAGVAEAAARHHRHGHA
jgi:hypothetical protein